MKSFKVNININDATCGYVDDLLTLKEWVAKDRVTVTELPEIKQPQMIESGILMSYDEITRTTTDRKDRYELGKSTDRDGTGWFVDNGERCAIVGKRIVIAEHVFPREFYKDIQTSIDWESIKVGSLVECACDDDLVAGYYCEHMNEDWVRINQNKKHSNWTGYSKNSIKSVRVIEEAK